MLLHWSASIVCHAFLCSGYVPFQLCENPPRLIGKEPSHIMENEFHTGAQ